MSTTNPANPFWAESFVDELEACGALISEKEFFKKSLKEETMANWDPLEVLTKYIEKGSILGVRICFDRADKNRIGKVLVKYGLAAEGDVPSLC